MTFLRRLCLIALLLSPALLHAQTNQLFGAEVSSISAGSGDTPIIIDGNFPIARRTFRQTPLCFYTGYGSTAPLSKASGDPEASFLNVIVPASTIQQIPPSAFSGGEFDALVYATQNTTDVCNGTYNSDYTNAIAVPILLPSLSQSDLTAIPALNPNLGGIPAPTEIYLSGSNFVPGEITATFSGAGFDPIQATVSGSSPTYARLDVRAFPANPKSIDLNLCNHTSSANFCTQESVTIAVTPLASNPGTLTATPHPTTPATATSLQAVFGSPDTGAGVPTGLVTFTDTTTAKTLGTAPLSLASGQFVPAPAHGVFTEFGGNFQPTFADFNRDGLQDVMIAAFNTININLASSNLGTFGQSNSINLDDDFCSSVVSATVGDFDGDGYPDIAALCVAPGGGSTNLMIYTNQGDGTFALSSLSNSIYAVSPYDLIAAGDFNKDGKIDLALAGPDGNPDNASETGISILLNDGSGNFSASSSPILAPLADGSQIAAIDFNADGYPDLAILGGSPGSGNPSPFVIFQNDGTGSFSGTPVYQTFFGDNTSTISFSPRTIASSKYPDIVAVSQGSSPSFAVILNSQTSNINFANTQYVVNVPNIQSIAVGDYNGDGNQDVAVYDGTNISVYNSSPTGLYGTPLDSFTLGANVSRMLGSTDPNADGYADPIALASGSFDGYGLEQYITSGSASATLTGQTFASGSHNLTATTPGTTTLSSGSASTTLNSNSTTPTLTVIMSPSGPTTYTPTGSQTFTADVLSPSGPAPGGTVTFFDGTTSLSTQTLSGVSSNESFASILRTFTAGTHSLSFTYSGDGNFSGGTSATTTYVVNKATPVVTWTPTTPTITYGTGLGAGQLNARATVGGTSVAGTFTYTASSGTVTTGSILPGGSNPLTVTFVPTDTADYNTPTGTVGATITVGKATSSIGLTVNPVSPINYTPTGTESITATITAGPALATGTIQFFDGSTLLGTQVTSSGAAPLTVGPLAAGTHPLTVVYGGDVNYSGSTSTITNYVVNKATPVVTWIPTTSTITYGTGLGAGQLNATATVGATTVAGTFTYKNALGTVVTTGTVLPVGSDALTATFLPTDTTDYNTPTGPVGTTITVNKATAGISLSVLPVSPTTYSPTGTETLTANVTVSTSPLATGTVQFFDGSTSLGSASLVLATSSSASITVGPLTAGTHSLTAVYSGDGDYNGITSSPTTYVVNKATPTLAWTPTTPTITYGTALSTAQLNATATVGGTAIAGTFTYKNASGTVVSIGTILPVGTNNLTASFVPTDTTDYITPTGTASTTITVNKASPAIALTVSPVSPTTYAPNGTEVLTGTINLPATGTLQFFDGSTPLGLQILVVGSTSSAGSITVGPLAAGTHSLTVVYSGDPNDNGLTSTPTSYIVNKVTPVVTWIPTTPTITYGTGLGAGQLNATATVGGTAVAGTFTYKNASSTVVTTGTVLPVGSNPLTVTFVPTDTTDYTTPTTPVSTTITVTKAAAGITLSVSPPSPNTYSPSAGSNETLTATVTVSSSPLATGTVQFFDGATSLGTAPLVVSTSSTASVTIALPAGTHSLTAVYSGDGNYAAVTSASSNYVVIKATPQLAWSPITPTITYGTPLGAGQLNATATVGGVTIPGTFTYKNASGTIVNPGAILPVGPNALTGTFAPTDTTDYNTPPGPISATITVTKGASAIALSAAPVSPTTYAPAGTETLTATLTVAGSPLATGSVQFFDGSTSLGTQTLVPGSIDSVTSITVGPLAAGTHSLTAIYSGDGNYSGMTSSATSYVVNKATPVVAWTPTIPNLAYGMPLGAGQLNATATVGGTAVAGTFTYKNASGTVVSTGTVLPVGTNPLTVTFVPTDTTNYSTPTATVGTTITVNKATSSVGLTVSPVSPTTYSPTSPETLTATVTVGGSPVASGSVQFFDASTSLGTQTLVPGSTTSTASITLSSPLTAGTHSLTAVYSGDTNYLTTTSTATSYVVNKATPVVAWTPAISSIVFGTGLTGSQLNATATVGGTAVAGAFTYKNASGTAVTTGTILPVGTNPLTVSFVPTDTTDYITPTGTVGTPITVTKASSGIAMMVTPEGPTTYSPTSPETLTAIVTIGSSPAATGTVQFFDGSTPLGTQTLVPGSTTSTASLTVSSSLTAGTHSLTAVYSGDANYGGVTSSPISYVVNKATPVVAWTPTTPNIAYGMGLGAGQLNATSTVSGTNVAGTFTYKNASGTVVTTGTILPVGSDPLTVAFVPTDTTDYNTPTGTAGATINVSKANATITLAVNPVSPTTYSPTIDETLTATVTVGGSPLATGSVQFFDGSTSLGTATLVAGSTSSTASITLTTPLTAGTHSLTALYSGDTNYLTITSTATNYVVNKATPTLAWTPTVSTITYGTPLSASQLNATAAVSGTNVPGTFTYKYAGNVVTTGSILPVGSDPLTATFVPTDTADYNTPTGTAGTTITVNKGGTAVNLLINPASPTTYAPLPNGVETISSYVSNAPGTPVATGIVSYYDGSTLLGSGRLTPNPSLPTTRADAFSINQLLTVGTHSLTAVYNGDGNYNSMTSAVTTYVVNQGTPVIGWTPNPANITFGTPLVAGQLNATATIGGTTVPGTFAYTNSFGKAVQAGTILPVGADVLTATFTPTDTTDFVSGGTTQATITVTPTSFTAPSTPVGSTSGVQTADVSFTTAGTLGSINVLTLGAPNLDYKLVTGGTCAGGTAYTVGQVCTVMYTFTPSVPGTRLGGITLTSTISGVTTVLGNSFLGGTGTGPQVIYTGNNTFTQVPTSFSSASGVAIDGSGNLFVADYGNPNGAVHGFVKEVFASTGYTTSAQIGSGFQYPQAIAVDGNGNVFVGDVGNVYEILAAGGYTNTVTVGSGIGQSFGVTLDGNGDLYVSDQFNSNVRKFTSASGYKTSTTLGSGFKTPQGLAVDASGNVFVADEAHNAVYEILAAGGYTTVNTLGSGFNFPQAVALEPDGNLLVTDFGNSAVKELVASTGYTTTNTIATSQPGYGLFVDGSGNIFLSAGNLDELNRSTPPSLTFPTTAYGATSAAQNVPIANDGNATLTFSALATSATDFTLSGSTCTATGTLAAGAGCAVGVTFTPQSVGTLTGTANITDDALNVAGTIQSIPLAGTSIQTTKTITFPQPATPVALNSGAALTAMASNGNPITYSVLSGTASIEGSSITFTTAGTVIIAANSPATLDYAAAAQVTRTVQVQQATPTITFAPNPASITYGTALSTAQLDATASVDGTFVYTTASNAVVTTGTVLPPGANAITASFTPSNKVNYLSPGPITQTINVSPAATTTTVTPSVNPSQFGQSVTFTVGVTSAYTGTALTGSVNVFDGTTIIGASATPNGTVTTAALSAGSHSITAVYTGNANFATGTSNALTQIVNASTTSITWAQPASIVYGTRLSAAQLNATVSTAFAASVPGTFKYTPDIGTLLPAGPQTLSVVFTPTDTASFKTATGSVTLTVTKATPTVNWTAPAAITAGTPLSATQLKATALDISSLTLPGTFTYNPAAGTILAPGATTLNVTFVPTDTADYTNGSASVPLTVNPAVPTITVTSSANLSEYGQPVTFTVNITSVYTGAPIAGSVRVLDGATVLGTPTLVSGTATVNTSTLTAGAHNITATYVGDANFAGGTSQITQTVNPGVTTITWPRPASITYGTPISATQQTATVATPYFATVPGTFAYRQPIGTVLTAGAQTLSVVFTPTDTVNFKPANGSVTLNVGQAAPVLAWATPQDIVQGTPLSGTQLNATATGAAGALSGTFAYNPAAGTLLTAGAHTLGVTFTPTDTTDYTIATTSVQINVIAVGLTSLSTNTASLGDAAKTITLTGAGFVTNSVVQLDGTAIATTFVNKTTLTAVIPATYFTTVHTIQVTVNDPTQQQTTNALTIAVTAPAVTVTLTGPGTVTTAAQPNLTFALPHSYPVDITGTFTLSFTPSPGLPNDPTVLFPNGTTTMSFIIPANTTATPPVVLQSGSVAGTITVTLTLSAGGQPLIPTPLVPPVVITDPTTVPGINNVTLTRSGNSLTVAILGFSNIREIDHVDFHFIPAPGQTLATSDLSISGAALFGPYYSSAASQQVGSTFEYDQVFNLSQDASVVGQVQVTLVNTLGSSESETAQ